MKQVFSVIWGTDTCIRSVVIGWSGWTKPVLTCVHRKWMGETGLTDADPVHSKMMTARKLPVSGDRKKPIK